MDAIRHNHPSVSDPYLILDRLLPWHESPMTMGDFKSQLAAHQGAVLIKTHVPPTLEPFRVDTSLLRYVQSLFAESDVVYVYRDGRDVLVSLYYYMRHYDQAIRNISFSGFIRMKSRFDTLPRSDPRLNRAEYWKSHVEGWLGQSGIATVSYEDLHADYEGMIAVLAGRLGFETKGNVKRVHFPGNRHRSSWLDRQARRVVRVLRGRSMGVSSAILARKGAIGEWRQHFSSQDIALFNSIAGDLLEELGYVCG
jgi:hypothetical protein